MNKNLINLPEEIRIPMNTAMGWLELENPNQALKELDGIEPRFREHIEVLRLRAFALSDANQPQRLRPIARALMQRDLALGWILYAGTFIGDYRFQRAIDLLTIAAFRYPKDPVIPFHLAILHAYLQETPDSKQWLQRSRNNKFFDIPHDDFVKKNRCTHKLLELLQTISN
jgi:hypothetical protein